MSPTCNHRHTRSNWLILNEPPIMKCGIMEAICSSTSFNVSWVAQLAPRYKSFYQGNATVLRRVNQIGGAYSTKTTRPMVFQLL